MKMKDHLDSLLYTPIYIVPSTNIKREGPVMEHMVHLEMRCDRKI